MVGHALCTNVSARVELSVDAAAGERLCVCCDPSCRECVHDLVGTVEVLVDVVTHICALPKMHQRA